MEKSQYDEYVYSSSDHLSLEKMADERPKYRSTHHLDAVGKVAAMKVSPSIVSLVSFSGEALMAQCSGTIIEVEENNNVVMTSLSLLRQPNDPAEAEFAENSLANDLKIIIRSDDGCSYVGGIWAYDYHYNVLIVKFKSNVSLQPAKLRMIDFDIAKDTSLQLDPKVKVGDPVVVAGRYFYRSFDLMASSGCLCMNRSQYDCRELLITTCGITMCGDGGPLINLAGEVIGIAFFQISLYTHILPIYVAYKLWNHYKRFKELHHPSYGFDVSNLFEADMLTLERLWKRFPSITNGLLVEKVWAGSYAESCGLREDDVIIKCDGKYVKSFSELWNLMWDKVGEHLELEVFRVDLSDIMNISMMVGEACPDKLNDWPRFDCPRGLLYRPLYNVGADIRFF